jgi:hypothetical protein
VASRAGQVLAEVEVVVDGHPAGVDDVDHHQGVVVREVDEDVLRRMVGAVPGQLDALAAHLQGVTVGEGHLRRRPCRVVIAKQPAGLLVPDPHNVLEQRGSTERTESSADRCQAQAARRAISRWTGQLPG